jgi:type 2 lantibiotic biosynthesis protein LanM
MTAWARPMRHSERLSAGSRFWFRLGFCVDLGHPCAATRTLKRQIDHQRGSLSRIGGFTGWGGSIYTLTNLGVLWSDPDLLDRAEDLTRLLVPLIELDDHHGVISGAAGCVAALTRLHQVRPSAATLSAAITCGDHLLLRSRPAGGGRARPNPALSERPLTGFSHGAAGIAWALLELGTLSGHERFRAAAREALTYERELFDPVEANWPDLRTLADRSDKNAMTAWCHGAAGIGLGRLAMLRDMPDPALRAEVDIAVATTTAHGFGRNHSLCHGDLGNVEILRCAAEVLREPSLLSQVDRASAQVLSEIDREGWVCGIPLEVESPGLMTGLAGIGHGLLRLAEPGMVPSVLLLAGPLGSEDTRKPTAAFGGKHDRPVMARAPGRNTRTRAWNGNRASDRRADS